MEERGIICLFRLFKLSGDTVEINLSQVNVNPIELISVKIFLKPCTFFLMARMGPPYLWALRGRFNAPPKSATGRGIKVTARDSAIGGHFWLKFGRVLSIYGALMLLNFCGDLSTRLELNFLGFQIEGNFWEAKF